MSDVSMLQPGNDYITSPILIMSRLIKLMLSKDILTSKFNCKTFSVFFCLGSQAARH